MLFVRNYDKPGFIGALGQALGAAEVNIATFHLGRTAPGRGRDRAGRGRPAADPDADRHGARLPNVIQAKAMRF